MTRTLKAAGALIMAVSLCPTRPVQARDLGVAVNPTTLDAVRGVLIVPFAEQSGASIVTSTTSDGLDTVRAHATGDDAWDVVMVRPIDAQAGCDQGLFEKLDWTTLGGKDRFLAGASDCGAGAIVEAVTLAWDRDKFQGTPTWSDFWDIAKYPGKRGLQRGAQGTLEIALMADGVAPSDVYKTMRGSDGVERAFRKLDQLKPYLSFWKDAADAPRWLSSGEVLMTAAPSAGVVASARAQHRVFGMQWTGALFRVDDWAILKGSPEAALAARFLVAATDPKTLVRLAPFGLGGLVKGSADGLPPDQAATSPTANLAAGLVIDDAFWRENGEKLGARFDAWLAK